MSLIMTIRQILRRQGTGMLAPFYDVLQFPELQLLYFWEQVMATITLLEQMMWKTVFV